MPTLAEIQRVQAEITKRGQQWHGADAATQKKLADDNLADGTAIGAKRNDAAGTWDYSGVKIDPDPKPDYYKDMQTSIEQMTAAEKAQRVQALRQQQAKATGQLNQQKAEVKPQYQDKRNQASFQSAQSVQSLREAMANAGLFTSGERFNNQTGEGAQNIARENALNGFNLQEQQTLNDYDRRIADVNDPSQEMQIEAALNAEKARMLYDAQNKATEYGRQDARYVQEDAFTKGQLNGTYVDPDTQAKIDRLTMLKDANAQGLFPQMQAEADSIRAYLDSRGINANQLFGADVAPGQAHSNAGLVGTRTLQGQELDHRKFLDDRNYDYQVGRDAVGDTRWNKEFEMKGQELAHRIGFDWANLSQRDKEYLGQLAVSQQNANTSSDNLQLSRDELKFKQGLEDAKKNENTQTQQALSDLARFNSKQEAMNHVKSQGRFYQEKGVNVGAILEMVDRIFPDPAADPYGLGK